MTYFFCYLLICEKSFITTLHMIFELTIYSCRKKLDTNSDYGRVVQGNSIKKSFEPRSEPNQTIEQKQCIVNPIFFPFFLSKILYFTQIRSSKNSYFFKYDN